MGRRQALRLTYFPLAALALAFASLGGATLSFGPGDAVVERGFERAFAELADSSDGHLAPAQTISGTEHFWLTNVAHVPEPVVQQPVTVGDRITIGSGDRARVLNVVDVREVDNKIIPVSHGETPARVLLVTCREPGHPEARPVRFVIEADDTLPGLTTVKAPQSL